MCWRRCLARASDTVSADTADVLGRRAAAPPHWLGGGWAMVPGAWGTLAPPRQLPDADRRRFTLAVTGLSAAELARALVSWVYATRTVREPEALAYDGRWARWSAGFSRVSELVDLLHAQGRHSLTRHRSPPMLAGVLHDWPGCRLFVRIAAEPSSPAARPRWSSDCRDPPGRAC